MCVAKVLHLRDMPYGMRAEVLLRIEIFVARSCSEKLAAIIATFDSIPDVAVKSTLSRAQRWVGIVYRGVRLYWRLLL